MTTTIRRALKSELFDDFESLSNDAFEMMRAIRTYANHLQQAGKVVSRSDDANIENALDLLQFKNTWHLRLEQIYTRWNLWPSARELILIANTPNHRVVIPANSHQGAALTTYDAVGRLAREAASGLGKINRFIEKHPFPDIPGVTPAIAQAIKDRTSSYSSIRRDAQLTAARSGTAIGANPEDSPLSKTAAVWLSEHSFPLWIKTCKSLIQQLRVCSEEFSMEVLFDLTAKMQMERAQTINYLIQHRWLLDFDAQEEGCVDDVDIRSIATQVSRTPKTVSSYAKDWPKPKRDGGGSVGRLWSYNEILPILRKQFEQVYFPDDPADLKVNKTRNTPH